MDQFLQDLADEEKDLRAEISSIESLEDLQKRVGELSDEEKQLLAQIEEEYREFGHHVHHLTEEQNQRLHQRVMEMAKKTHQRTV